MNGKFVISLDYELHWGVFDIMSVDDYFENLANTEKAVDEMVALSNEFDVRLTFATVGFLFAADKNELLHFSPVDKPDYINRKLDPYSFLESIGANKQESPFHYACESIASLHKDKRHEIGTHTFSHYYCREDAQTKEQFDADLKSAIAIAQARGITIQSIVFPRNQVREEYLEVCAVNGITSYRGTETAGAYDPNVSMPKLLKRGLRMLDSYFNVTGHHTVPMTELHKRVEKCVNLPSSRFLRPYDRRLRMLNGLKLNRIKKSMTYAAKTGHLYHLWWHPHNFGKDLDRNISDLREIYRHFHLLQKKYGFESETMTSLTNKIKAYPGSASKPMQNTAP